MSNANKILLNARVRRLDGTITYINKINANGYSTDAKGPQIPVKRIVFAGKSLKEIEQPFEKGEFVIVQGVAVKLNKRQQRELAEGTLDEKALRPEFGRLAFIDRDDGKATDGKKVKPKAVKKDSGLKATRKQNGDTRTKKERKAEAAAADDSLDMIKSTPIDRKAELANVIDATIEDATTKERRKLLSESFDMDWKDVKKHGGKGVVKHMGRKAAQAAVNKLSATVTQDAFIKQMPAALKRLIQDGTLTLNKAQIERVLSALDLDVRFYSIAMQTLLGNLKLSLERAADEPKAVKKVKKQKVRQGKPTYASEKDQKRRIKKMSCALLAPSKKDLKELKSKIKAAKATIAKKLGLKDDEVKRGLIVYRPNGVELMFVACDLVGPVFIEKDGDRVQFNYAHVGSTFDLRLTEPSELDATV
ncbi:hypothetical protein HOT49_gp326 [Erwinia phage vB_EamM_Alexandra]|uniref:Uncharacterized protein n=1 Tax=Erwinia phage vB_EamM_Alexandra TaxID=2201424 RepID=A0A2Z4QFJ7_9CAUD|nr:hypothetical protein HOT49_gp326 [Erwinia phage vB_EamM_Alexandra]AWY08581.1 hypothetical protein Alexandra_330 [Erwinia phage vB_EamM_Alexandra]